MEELMCNKIEISWYNRERSPVCNKYNYYLLFTIYYDSLLKFTIFLFIFIIIMIVIIIIIITIIISY